MTDYSIRLAHLFLDGEEQAAISLIHSVLEEDDRLTLYEDLLTPAMVHIGKLWERNEISVADEHLATAICDFVITDYEFRQPAKHPGSRKRVMLFGVEGEEHYLGLKMAAAVFKNSGWNVRYLGPNLPLRHAETAVNAWNPDVVAMGATLSYRLPILTESVQVLSATECHPTIVIGGRMAAHTNFFEEEQRMGKIVVLPDLRGLEDWISQTEREVGSVNALSQ